MSLALSAARRRFCSAASPHRTLRVYQRGWDGSRESRRYRDRSLVPGILYGFNEEAVEKRYLVAMPRSTLDREASARSSFECAVYDLELVSLDPAALGVDTAARDGGILAAIEACTLRDRDALRDDPSCGGAALVEGMEVADRCTVVPRDMQLHAVTDQANSVNFIRYLNREQRERAFETRNKSTKSRSKFARGLKVQVPLELYNMDACTGLKMGGWLNVQRYFLECRAYGTTLPDAIRINMGGMKIGDRIIGSEVLARAPDQVREDLVALFPDEMVVAVAGKKGKIGEDEEEAFGEGGAEAAVTV